MPAVFTIIIVVVFVAPRVPQVSVSVYVGIVSQLLSLFVVFFGKCCSLFKSQLSYSGFIRTNSTVIPLTTTTDEKDRPTDNVKQHHRRNHRSSYRAWFICCLFLAKVI